MYKPLTNNKLIVFLLVWGLLGMVLGGLTTCSLFPSASSTAPAEQTLRGTWQGRALGERDSTFVKFTFLPDHRYRLVILRLPAGSPRELSGTLMQKDHSLHLTSPSQWKIERLVGSEANLPSLRLLPSGDSLAFIDLTPFNAEFTEKAWALVARADSVGDTLFYDRKDPLLLRFRAYNFDIQVIASDPGIWGYYLSRPNSIFIRPLDGFSGIAQDLTEGWYQTWLVEHLLVLKGSQGVMYVFKRKLF